MCTAIEKSMIYLSAQQLCARANVTPMTLWRWQQLPDFPAPVRIGRRRFWEVNAVARWLADRS